jgi:hypothetical protein
VGEVGVKHGDIGGGTAEASRMPDGTGVASGMAKPTGIVEDHAEMAEWSWMPSGMAEADEINEDIVTPRACWVVGAIGLAESSGMLVVMSIPSKKIIEI